MKEQHQLYKDHQARTSAKLSQEKESLQKQLERNQRSAANLSSQKQTEESDQSQRNEQEKERQNQQRNGRNETTANLRENHRELLAKRRKYSRDMRENEEKYRKERDAERYMREERYSQDSDREMYERYRDGKSENNGSSRERECETKEEIRRDNEERRGEDRIKQELGDTFRSEDEMNSEMRRNDEKFNRNESERIDRDSASDAERFEDKIERGSVRSSGNSGRSSGDSNINDDVDELVGKRKRPDNEDSTNIGTPRLGGNGERCNRDVRHFRRHDVERQGNAGHDAKDEAFNDERFRNRYDSENEQNLATDKYRSKANRVGLTNKRSRDGDETKVESKDDENETIIRRDIKTESGKYSEDIEENIEGMEGIEEEKNRVDVGRTDDDNDDLKDEFKKRQFREEQESRRRVERQNDEDMSSEDVEMNGEKEVKHSTRERVSKEEKEREIKKEMEEDEDIDVENSVC